MGLNWLVDSNNRWIVFTTSCHLLGMGAKNKKKKTGGTGKGGTGGSEGGGVQWTHTLTWLSLSLSVSSLLISSGQTPRESGRA